MLPPLYEMDDYTSCITNNNIYCKIKANLRSNVNDSYVWKYIENSVKGERTFQRTALYRTFCIPKHLAGDDLSIAKYSEKLVNERIQHLNLNSMVDVIACTDGIISRTTYDYIVGLVVILYGCLIAFATFQDIRRTNDEKDDGLLGKLSFRFNWSRRTLPSKNVGYENLISIQGLRFYTAMLILLLHTEVLYAFSFIENPSVLEDWQYHPVLIVIQAMAPYLVHVFFTISSWLLTIQIRKICQTHGKVTFRHILRQVINRYLRLVVALAVLILLTNTSWMSVFSGANNFDFIPFHSSTCEKNWHATLLLFNNFLYGRDICIITTWYLSADFQLYVANTFILFVLYKYELNQIRAFLILLLMNSSFNGVMIYVHDLDAVLKLSIRNLEMSNGANTDPFFILYTSPLAAWPSSCIGMIMGTLYSKIGDESKQKNNFWAYLYIPIFFTFPMISAFIAMFNFRGIEAALLGIIVKPMFAIGIGMGIMGMSRNDGGIIKKIFEWRPVVQLGNFTYCIYLCHVVFCFMKPSAFPTTVGFLELIQNFMRDALLSIAVGIIFTLSVEEPGITLQQILLAQIDGSGKSGKKTKSN